MPDSTKKVVVDKINLTRKGSNEKKWTPTTESCICNLHYKDFKGPTRSDNRVLPQYFKQPNNAFYQPPPKRRVLLCSLDTNVAAGKEIYSNHYGDGEKGLTDDGGPISNDDNSAISGGSRILERGFHSATGFRRLESSRVRVRWNLSWDIECNQLRE